MREISEIVRFSRRVSSGSLEKTKAMWERRKTLYPYQVKKNGALLESRRNIARR
jgi:hypothetical protein